MNKPAWVVIGIIVALAGSVFTLQGFDVMTGAAMSGTTFWKIGGPVVALAGLAFAGVGARGRSR